MSHLLRSLMLSTLSVAQPALASANVPLYGTDEVGEERELGGAGGSANINNSFGGHPSTTLGKMLSRVVVIAAFFVSPPGWGFSGGIDSSFLFTTVGCGGVIGCHPNVANAGVSVTIVGPDELEVGQAAMYTVSLDPGTAPGAAATGVNVVSEGDGVLGIAQPGTVIFPSGVLSHTAPAPGDFSWDFEVSAGATEGLLVLTAAINAVNGNLVPDVGDVWNRTELEVMVVPEAPECSDGIDNDDDGLADFPSDPGCDDANDPSERSPSLPCDDGIENDGDGLIDFPDDPGCLIPTWFTESPQCDDQVDNDGDGGVDTADRGCPAGWFLFEQTVCDDGLDNDEDGLVDFADDPSCGGLPFGLVETTKCSDGVDNDGDGLTDFPTDPECISAAQFSEANPNCGMGFELVLLLLVPPLFRLRRRRAAA